MAEFIVMPKLGFDMREAVLNSWLKNVGDAIEKGEIVAEIESDKATLELEAQTSGTLLHLLAESGDVMPIGANLAIVGAEGEDFSTMLGDSAPVRPCLSLWTLATPLPFPQVETACLIPEFFLGPYLCRLFAWADTTDLLIISGLKGVWNTAGSSTLPFAFPFFP